MQYIVYIWALSTLFMCSVTNAADLTEISVISLGAVEGSAVLKFPDNKMAVVHVGETIPGTGAMVQQVLANRLVVETVTDTSPATLEKFWIYKSRGQEQSEIRRLSSRPPEEPVREFEVLVPLKR